MQRPWPKAGFLFAALFCLIAAWTISHGDETSPEPLIIGMELNYPPFEMTDAAGNPSGVGVEMAHALGDYLHRPVTIENMPFEGLIPALKTGRIDLIISSMTATEERRKSIDFSDPYLSTGLAILVKKESPIQNITDVDKPGTIVTVKTGTTAARKRNPEELPKCRTIVPAITWLSDAPIPTAVAMAPSVTLNRPVPFVRSATTSTETTPKMPAPTPSRT